MNIITKSPYSNDLKFRTLSESESIVGSNASDIYYQKSYNQSILKQIKLFKYQSNDERAAGITKDMAHKNLECCSCCSSRWNHHIL